MWIMKQSSMVVNRNFWRIFGIFHCQAKMGGNLCLSHHKWVTQLFGIFFSFALSLRSMFPLNPAIYPSCSHQLLQHLLRQGHTIWNLVPHLLNVYFFLNLHSKVVYHFSCFLSIWIFHIVLFVFLPLNRKVQGCRYWRMRFDYQLQKSTECKNYTCWLVIM